MLRVHHSLESVAARPGVDDAAPHDLYTYSVPVRLGREDLLAAARVWEDDLTPFPER